MTTPNTNMMYEISNKADNSCTYLIKASGNAQAVNAVGKNEDEMQQIMDINKFVELLNTKVEENNKDTSKTKLKKWKFENGNLSFAE